MYWVIIQTSDGYIDFLNEITAEQQKRQQSLSDLEIEDWKTLREDLRKQEELVRVEEIPNFNSRFG